MLKGSDLFQDIYHDRVGKLILRLNQVKSWTKEKHALSNQLQKLLNKNGYVHGSGDRSDYRLHGGTGRSFIYKVPQNKKGALSQFRGEYVRVVCIGTHRFESFFCFKPIKKSVIDSYLLTRKISIVASREGSGMTSSWEEYLCLTYGDIQAYKVFEGRYMGLAEKEDYFDEELEDYDIPEFINGEVVTGIEDDYIVGGELSYESDDEAAEFTYLSQENLIRWLTDMKWDYCSDQLKKSYFDFHKIP
jgi:hypothetical protein